MEGSTLSGFGIRTFHIVEVVPAALPEGPVEHDSYFSPCGNGTYGAFVLSAWSTVHVQQRNSYPHLQPATCEFPKVHRGWGT